MGVEDYGMPILEKELLVEIDCFKRNQPPFRKKSHIQYIFKPLHILSC